MAGYFGTKQHQALQVEVENSMPWIAGTPGACNPGRFLGTDDPDVFGWEKIIEILERDKTFSFQLVAADKKDGVDRKLVEQGYRIDYWDVFVANRSEVRAMSNDALASEFRLMSASEVAEPDTISRIQAFLAANRIVPFSASMLAGEFGPVTTVAIVDKTNQLAAVAHGYFPHNAHSPQHLNAWGGLVAVSADHRGKGLGNYVNARLIANCFTELNAGRVHQFVASSNIPSRKMVEFAGLKLAPDLLCGLATIGSDRFTR